MKPTSSCNDLNDQSVDSPTLKKINMKPSNSSNDLPVLPSLKKLNMKPSNSGNDQPNSPSLKRINMKPSNSCNDLPEQSGSPTVTPRTPAVVVSNSSKALASSASGKSLLGSNSSKSLVVSSSSKSLLGSNSSKSLLVSGSSKALGQKMKYVKQVTGKNNDTELHLAAQRGEASAVKEILGEIDAQMLQTLSGTEFDEEVAEIRSAVVHEVNELGETPLFTAAERGHINVVEELLPYMTKEGLAMKNKTGFDALHIAASQGHQAIVQLLLDCDPELSKTIAQSNSTALVSAASRGHTSVVKVLLEKDPSLIHIPRSNGKNALHLAVRQGYVEIVEALLAKETQLPRRTDKKGQTPLHMAVKGVSSEVVRLLLQADPASVMLQDKFGNLALHVAARKKRTEIVNEILLVKDTDVNALTRDNRTALDIVIGLPLSEEAAEMKECLMRYGGFTANELNNQPRDELRKTVTEIRNDVHSQLEQARKTNRNMNGIAKELQKLHRAGILNAANSVTVVAVLFATVAFAAIFTVPGGDDDNGMAVMVHTAAFKIFFISNAFALFTSLAVVVVQITVVRGEIKSERRVIEVINKLMWLASVCTSVSFISSSYIVVGRRNRWAAVLVTVIGSVTMIGLLGGMTYYVVKSKRIRRVRKREKYYRNRSNFWHDLSDSDINSIYAI
ncbi:PGG domain-containing protein [Heracleum sosnowskyi]|uniref:PGG domain-containing protein n=1 Tax=Heracleum sosnowskyi TaxID=360622 RepID=A0AAD8N8W6_9APIA|nr:PGG domain-containing protein [Heracleum sosnowskyi]